MLNSLSFNLLNLMSFNAYKEFWIKAKDFKYSHPDSNGN